MDEHDEFKFKPTNPSRSTQTPAVGGRPCLVLLSQGQGAVQRQHDPAPSVCGVNLTGLLDGGDLRHTAEEEEQVSSLLRRITLIDALQDPEVRPGVQFL